MNSPTGVTLKKKRTPESDTGSVKHVCQTRLKN